MFYLDQGRCLGCGACVTACLAWHAPLFGGMESAPRRRRVVAAEYGEAPPRVDRRYWSVACQHCAAPACAAACPKKCIHRGGDGTVFIDWESCVGCGACQRACPWQAIHMVERRPDKCDGCRQRVEDGKKPACVAGCPLRALDFGPREALLERHPGAVPWPAGDGPFPEKCADTRPATLIRLRRARV